MAYKNVTFEVTVTVHASRFIDEQGEGWELEGAEYDLDLAEEAFKIALEDGEEWVNE